MQHRNLTKKYTPDAILSTKFMFYRCYYAMQKILGTEHAKNLLHESEIVWVLHSKAIPKLFSSMGMVPSQLHLTSILVRHWRLKFSQWLAWWISNGMSSKKWDHFWTWAFFFSMVDSPTVGIYFLPLPCRIAALNSGLKAKGKIRRSGSGKRSFPKSWTA